MACKCGSFNQSKFIAEMGIRSPGPKHIDKPVVWVFPELAVCMDCGKAWTSSCRKLNCVRLQETTRLQEDDLKIDFRYSSSQGGVAYRALVYS